MVLAVDEEKRQQKIDEGNWKIGVLIFPMAIYFFFYWGKEKPKCNGNIDRKPQIKILICKGIPWDFPKTIGHNMSNPPSIELASLFQTKEDEKAINLVG